jgi:hypothetical protein
VHDLLDNMPQNTELMETKAGMKRYYSPEASPTGEPIFTVQEPSGPPELPIFLMARHKSNMSISAAKVVSTKER